jgi:hypothetical protein
MADDPLDLDIGLPAGIAADAATLAPITLSVARRLRASADANGIMRPDYRMLARELDTDVAAIVAALDQLVRRGHLIVGPGSAGERTGYRFVGTPPVPKSAHNVVPFPRQQDERLVAHHAENMAHLSGPNARLYLRRMMRVYAEEMRSRGIVEPIIEREVDALSRAIKSASFPLVLLPDDQEPA